MPPYGHRRTHRARFQLRPLSLTTLREVVCSVCNKTYQATYVRDIGLLRWHVGPNRSNYCEGSKAPPRYEYVQVQRDGSELVLVHQGRPIRMSLEIADELRDDLRIAVEQVRATKRER